MAEEPASLDLSTVRHEWIVSQVETLEAGPLRAALWVRLEAGASRVDFTFTVLEGVDRVQVGARVFWNERSARLKLVMPAGDQATFEAPGGSVHRGPVGEAPGGRWATVRGEAGEMGFVTDALTAYDCKDGAFRATIVRASRYATDVPMGPDSDPWRPAVDCGELRFWFVLTATGAGLPRLARELAQPPQALLVPPSPGDLPRAGSLASLGPSSVQMLALKPAEDDDGWILRLQETAGVTTTPRIELAGATVALSELRAYGIGTWRLRRAGTGWDAEPTNASED
jgi:alpha-mannosidase